MSCPNILNPSVSVEICPFLYFTNLLTLQAILVLIKDVPFGGSAVGYELEKRHHDEDALPTYNGILGLSRKTESKLEAI